MILRKIWFGSFGAFLSIFLFSFGFASETVLIKIDLKSEQDYRITVESGAKAYVRFDNTYIGEIERDKIERLEKNNVQFQILDEAPWTQDYFLVSKSHFRAKVNPLDFGQILLEKDDFTILKTDQSKALELLNAGYRLTKIFRERIIPLKYVSPPSPSIPEFSYSPMRDSLVLQVSADSLRNYVGKLQSYQTRFVLSDSLIKARHWLYNKLKDFGIDSVYFHPFSGPDGYGMGYWVTDSNVVAVIPGTVNPDKVVVIGAHYDSIVWPFDPSNFNQPAPGADDNASGTAGVLEIARILVNHPLSKTVILVLFSAEELWMIGSYGYAFDAYNNGMDIMLMLNMDMIGYYENQRDILVHRPAVSAPYGLVMSNLAGLYTDLNVLLSPDAASDNLPFSQVGYNTLFSIEYIFNTYYHTASESLTYLDFSYMSKIVKMNIATLVEVAESPGPVKGLEVWDAGDGDKLYLNWSPLLENGLTGYKIYYGTRSGVYTDTQIVSYSITTDTLRGLQSDTTYYIAVAAVNSSGKQSIYKSEIAATPRVVPLAPSGLTAHTGYFKINLSWQPNKEVDFSHYNLYRSLSSGSGFNLLASGLKGFSYVDSTVQGGIWYHYQLTAVDTTGNESVMSDEAQMIAITLDQGILVVDEAANSRGIPPWPSSDAQQDSFYTETFSGYRSSFYEYTSIAQQPGIIDLGPYSTVVWLDDDFLKSNFMDNKDYELIKEYIGYGGRFILFSWIGLRSFKSLPRTYLPGSFMYDYLHITWANEDAVNDFVEAVSLDTSSYPSLEVDTSRTIVDSLYNWGGKLKYIEVLSLRPEATPLYSFDSFSNDTAFEGKVCGLKYDGPDYKLAFFTFPLFYMDKSEAKRLVSSLMRDFGEPLGVEDNPSAAVPLRFTLSQNYPNPFNPSTTIPFQAGSRKLGAGSPVRTSLKIYNILGQLVRTLVDEEKAPGNYKVVWDGKDNSGKEVGSGIYFYQLRTEEYTATKKMVLLR